MSIQIFISKDKALNCVRSKSFIYLHGLVRFDVHQFRNDEGEEIVFDTWLN